MSKRPQPEPEGALYVRLPAEAVERLHRAAEALGVHKKDLIAGLVTKYIDPDSKRGLSALGTLAAPKRATISTDGPGPQLGSYAFQAYDPPEVMNVEQVAQLLQVDAKLVLELAEGGKLPGRRLGYEWRFSRTAVLGWLANAEAKK
jgi:excisionase family DNA binding protein